MVRVRRVTVGTRMVRMVNYMDAGWWRRIVWIWRVMWMIGMARARSARRGTSIVLWWGDLSPRM